MPVLLVVWPAGQSRQEVEAGAGWYLETGHGTQALLSPKKVPRVQSAAPASCLSPVCATATPRNLPTNTDLWNAAEQVLHVMLICVQISKPMPVVLLSEWKNAVSGDFESRRGWCLDANNIVWSPINEPVSTSSFISSCRSSVRAANSSTSVINAISCFSSCQC